MCTTQWGVKKYLGCTDLDFFVYTTSLLWYFLLWLAKFIKWKLYENCITNTKFLHFFRGLWILNFFGQNGFFLFKFLSRSQIRSFSDSNVQFPRKCDRNGKFWQISRYLQNQRRLSTVLTDVKWRLSVFFESWMQQKQLTWRLIFWKTRTFFVSCENNEQHPLHQWFLNRGEFLIGGKWQSS